jgi:hypothetical protein
VAVLGLYMLWLDRRAALAFVLGGLPAAAVFATYNWVSFGSPLNIGYMNLLPGGFAAGMSEGILGVGWPKLTTAGDLLFGPRGLVRLAPWFLVAPAGLLAVRRREVRAEVVVCAAICVLFAVYNAGYYLPFGGWTPGPRFLLPALPFAAVLVGLASPTLRFFTSALMVAAAAVFFVATVTMPNAPERFTDPLFELWLPSLDPMGSRWARRARRLRRGGRLRRPGPRPFVRARARRLEDRGPCRRGSRRAGSRLLVPVSAAGAGPGRLGRPVRRIDLGQGGGQHIGRRRWHP